MNIIDENIKPIEKLCRQHNVDKLYIFGSFVTDSFSSRSDIDLLVSFGDVDLFNYYDNYLGIKESLEKLLSRSIDLVEDQAVKNPILRRSIDRNKKLIYGRAS
jgi:uncharacterized protein